VDKKRLRACPAFWYSDGVFRFDGLPIAQPSDGEAQLGMDATTFFSLPANRATHAAPRRRADGNKPLAGVFRLWYPVFFWNKGFQ
jgi:hypothetical protein